MLYFIGDIKLPERVQIAMQLQVEAERKKRAAVLESEGCFKIILPYRSMKLSLNNIS